MRILLIVLLCLLVVYSMCRVSKNSDEKAAKILMKEMEKELERKNKFMKNEKK